MLLFVGMQGRFKKSPEFPEDIGECQNQSGNQGDGDMGSYLTGHFDADKVDSVCVDTESINVHQLAKLAKKAIRKKCWLFWGKNYRVKNQIFEGKCGNH